MDVQDECIIEEVTPSKAKKLKQARLSFQTLSSESPTNASTKKRKLESPGECKTPKIVKVTNKGNVVKGSIVKNKDSSANKSLNNSGSSIELIETEDDEKELNKSMNVDSAKRNKVEEKETKSNKPSNQDEAKRNNIKTKKSVPFKNKKKESQSPNTSLTKFFKKSDKSKSKDKSMDDSIQEDKEQDECEVLVIEGANEDDIQDSTKMDISITEEKADVLDKSIEISLLSTDSDSESSDNEDSGTKEVTNDEKIKDINGTSPRTPKQTSLGNANIKNRRVTPKLLQKQAESAKKREERERLKMEKEKKREEERENRRKEKEAEKEQKRKEKEQKELKKQMEMEQKQKEKEAKEQERRKREEAKEEEKRKKEEEKLEVERKKQKAASNFASFFVAKKQEVKMSEEENNLEEQTFMPFEVKADMRVAPITRRSLREKEKLSLDEKCNSGHTEKKDLYLAEIKEKKTFTRKSGKTWPLEAKDDVILLEEEENDDNANVVDQTPVTLDKNRAKLLQFHENRRPPYWGTWRKQSKTINPRRPFTKDSKWFDYEVDSDEEWEEEEPGESLRGSEDEKDEENPDDDEYDVDNEFMVPHGYLSDEEARADEEENENMTPETQKFKLKILGEQFEAERNEKTLRLKPKIIGCVWLGPDNAYPENTPKRVVDFLTARHAWVSQIPVVLPSKESENTEVECHTPAASRGATRKTRVPEEALPDLIRLVHGNTHGRKFLVREFLTFWSKEHHGKENQISKASLTQKIGEIGKWMSCPEEGQMHLKACWYVSEDIRKQYLPDEELALPNRWKYNLTPKRKSEIVDVNEKPEKQDKEKEKKTVPLITQFTKKITQEEMKRQLSTQPAKIEKPKGILQRPPKRAVLISVPRKEENTVPTAKTGEPDSKKTNNGSEVK